VPKPGLTLLLPRLAQFNKIFPENISWHKFIACLSVRVGIPMMWSERIVIDPEILTGKPVVKGTRLAVEFIVDLLAQGWSQEDILRNYPGLTKEDIQACLSYASSILRAEKVYPLKL
jgi:uncharacterized protein (DUF433 family)